MADAPDSWTGRFLEGRIGDKGQRYEIRGRRREGGAVDVIGWAEEHPERMVEWVKRWPRYVDAWYIDRHAKKDASEESRRP